MERFLKKIGEVLMMQRAHVKDGMSVCPSHKYFSFLSLVTNTLLYTCNGSHLLLVCTKNREYLELG